MDMPALKVAEIVIVVVAGVAFYVWQMRSLKRDRAETARQMAQAEALSAQQANAQDSAARDISLQEAELRDSPPAAPADRSRPA
jgi:type II secretory pathway pseudopilin PulG